ncbi:hypothetical protein DPMN_035185 [Dreissena polymorpha]|uniref:Uncharacterized protein n=1 Tax=Dreissena polymorpha TaxID=45954 RepID=A0A9D4M727_DREPO|nr:hypothetical protein DPMN_035185 [Dreissena polymorpha]
MSLSSRKMANMEMYLNQTVEGMASFQRNLHAFENMTEMHLDELEQFTENTFKLLVEAHDINMCLSDL